MTDLDFQPKKAQALLKSCQSPAFLDTLQEPFLSIARHCIPPKDDPLPLSPATERADGLEVELRSQFLSLIEKSLDGNGNAALETVGLFFSGALKLCCHLVYFCMRDQDERYKGMSVRKLPLVLLEDALEALPLPSFQHVWNHTVEPLFPVLFSDLLWTSGGSGTGKQKVQPVGALPFIKLCNKFLRKLYVREPGGSWAGRVLLTLADVFPLSDKSATKIWGSFNTENVTEFETQEEFEEQQQQQQQKQQQQQQEEALWHNKQKQLQNYSFYETFWQVQQDFSNPTGIKVADFLERMRTILAALESHPLIRTSKRLDHSTNANAGNDSNQDQNQDHHPPHVKYLTGSHLLPIQLGDAEFRIHFLTQFLIVANHLSSESPALGNALGPLQKRSQDLMVHIQPHGHMHLQLLETVLKEREKHWRQWKKNKCQPDMETPKVFDNGDADSRKRKRLLDGPLGDEGGDNAASEPKDEEERLIDFILHETKDLKSTCALPSASQPSSDAGATQERRGSYPSRNTRSKVVPSLEEHLESYVDAIDPDAGIEAAYHPKNDSLFTWRALRLLSRDHLQHFHMINHKGDFERMVRHIYKEEKGIAIPGEAPVEEHPSSTMEVTASPSPEEVHDDTDVGEDQEMEENDQKSLDEQEDKDDENDNNSPSQSRSQSPDEGARQYEAQGAMDEEEGEGEQLSEAGEEENEQEQSSPAPMDVEPHASGEGEEESDGPSREVEVQHDSDEGEIEEGKTRKDSELPSPAEEKSPAAAPEAQPSDVERPPSRNESHRRSGSKERPPSRNESHRRSGSKDSQPPPSRRYNESDRGNRQQQETQHRRSASPSHRDGGGRDGRSRHEAPPPLPPSGYNSTARNDRRDNSDRHDNAHQNRPGDSRGPPSGDRRGPGGGHHRGDVPPVAGRRDDRQGGAVDERWNERRGGADVGGRRGGGGGGSRRGGSGGGGGDRRGDRRGGDRRGGGRRRT